MSEDATKETNEEAPKRRSFFTRRRAVTAGVVVAVIALALTLVSLVAYKSGVADSYVKKQFTAKMADIGVVFTADAFRLTVNPLELDLQNATFNDKVSGEKLFFIRNAHLKMTVQDLYALQFSRDISIDKTEISGAEAWVKFDENGRSNFANLKLVEDKKGSAVNFKYDSVDFSLTDSVVHFGDLSRRVSGDAKNLVFLLSPENMAVAEDDRRYKFDLTSTDSNFKYDERAVEKIDIRAVGVADKYGAELSQFDLKTPIGTSELTGKLTDWAAPKYTFDIQSSLDLTQASSIFSAENPLSGVGNFKGTVTGEGETYKIEGDADAAGLRAGGVYLKAFNVNGTVAGTNTNYEANGRAVAEMLTFEDFRIDWLKLAGNVRGSGTDFRWLGELQAAAVAVGKDVSLGQLFLRDARAEFKDKQLTAEAGNGRVKRFAIGDVEMDELAARNMRLALDGNTVKIKAPSANLGSIKTKDFAFDNISGGSVDVSHKKGETHVNITQARAESGEVQGRKLKNLSVDNFRFTDLPRTTEVTAQNLRAGEADVNGMTLTGVEAPSADFLNAPTGLTVYSQKVRVAKVDSDVVSIGSINVGGVRLSVYKGRVEGKTDDINAGNVTLKKTKDLPAGGMLENVVAASPVFVLEPSGRYRVTSDMSLGGGTVGSVALGAAKAKVDVNNDRVALNELTANVMDGRVDGNATIALTSRSQSHLVGNFSNLDISKLIAWQGGSVIPLEGRTTGRLDLNFAGTNIRAASGTLNADITANAGSADNGFIPVNGKIDLSSVNGLFNVDKADLSTEKSRLTATGRFDLKNEDSDLTLALRSTDASEVENIVRVTGVSKELQDQIDAMQAKVGGNLTFDGTFTGNLFDPTIDGRASLDTLSLKGRDLGRVTTDISVSPLAVDLKNGKLTQGDGGSVAFDINLPKTGRNNTTVKAELTGVNAGNLLAALPVTLPEQIADLDGKTTGTVDITGLPDAAQGEINLTAATGMVGGQTFDNLKVKAVFAGTAIDLQQAEMRIGSGNLTAAGHYDRASKEFNFDVGGKTVPVPLLLAFLPKSSSIPVIRGDLDFTAKATGISDRASTYNVNFSGSAPDVQVDDSSIGQVSFKGVTADQRLTADLTASLGGNPQTVNANVDLSNDNLPFMVSTDFNQSPIAPFLAFVPQAKGVPVTGTATGRIELAGNLSMLDAKGNRIYSSANLAGTARFSQLALQIQDTPLAAAEPIMIRFNTTEIVFEKARFSGGGSNMTIAGTKALTDAGMNDLTIDGRVNLNLLNLATKDTFFTGFADTSVRLAGPNATARLTGTANIVNGSVATFLGTDRFTVDRLKARLIFTSNQIEVEEATGYLGGGKFNATGGGSLDGASLTAFRFALNGSNVTVPLPKDFTTTGDAQLEITGRRETKASDLQLNIAGRVNARKALYQKDIDLANLVGARRDTVLSSGGSSTNSPTLDLIIEGRDSLVVKNNIADLTASVSLRLGGDANNPTLAGRITATNGTILFRKDRYVVQRGVLEFPPDTAIDPVINLQAESEIAGYQVFVNLAGPLKDSEQLSATVRSSPALPQADVVSLITTGNLANTTGGIPTLAQSGINTAAEILTDTIINNPARKATDKLFGLNVFEIDPIISGQQLNPQARLTVGRQINNNLRVTYATNLSQDQNQVLAFEYRVSNKLSVVAQYEQRSLSNVTRNRDNFSFEVRFRKRF